MGHIDYQPRFGHHMGRRKASYANDAAQVGEKTAVFLLSDKLLESAIKDAFQDIADRTSSAASVALNAGALNVNSHVYQARFNSGDWSGQLLSLPIASDGTLGDPDWDTGVVLDSQNFDTGRTILTYNPSTKAGIAFRWTSTSTPLSTAQQTALNTNVSLVNDGKGIARLNDQTVRVTSSTAPCARGWYLDLPTAGERQVSDPVLRNGRIIFTTLIPDSQICSFGGTSFLMELDAVTGSPLLDPPFDLNADKKFDAQDKVIDSNGGGLVPSGIASTQGILPSPTILNAGSTELKYNSGSSGGVFITAENPGKLTGGRQAWHQLC